MDVMNVDEVERQDDEKNRIVNKLVDLRLSLTEEVVRLKDLIESTTMARRMAAAKPPPLQYSYSTALVEPFIRDVRQRQQQQQQQQEQRIDDVDVGVFDDGESNSSRCEDMIDCMGINDSRRVMRVGSVENQLLPSLKRKKLM